MISWIWAIGAFFAGVLFGIFLTVILVANREGDK